VTPVPRSPGSRPRRIFRSAAGVPRPADAGAWQADVIDEHAADATSASALTDLALGMLDAALVELAPAEGINTLAAEIHIGSQASPG
jgi:hypothetical protein